MSPFVKTHQTMHLKWAQVCKLLFSKVDDWVAHTPKGSERERRHPVRRQDGVEKSGNCENGYYVPPAVLSPSSPPLQPPKACCY